MGPHYDHQVGHFEAPDPVRQRDILLARARRARAEALADMLTALWSGSKAAGRGVVALVRHAGAGAALKPPLVAARHQRTRLTGGCY